MFYAIEKTETIEVKVELNAENVFCACPDCGTEVSVDLSCVFADGLGDMYSTAAVPEPAGRLGSVSGNVLCRCHHVPAI